jgi:hypothetical protein
MSAPPSHKVFVPSDTAARSLGAEAVADAVRREAERRGVRVEIVRNGSRGLYWLEPLVEVEVAGRRLAYGPIESADVAGLFEAGFLTGGEHDRRSARPSPFRISRRRRGSRLRASASSIRCRSRTISRTAAIADSAMPLR